MQSVIAALLGSLERWQPLRRVGVFSDDEPDGDEWYEPRPAQLYP